MKDFKRYFGISVHDAESYCEMSYRLGFNPLPELRKKCPRIPLGFMHDGYSHNMTSPRFGFVVVLKDNGMVIIKRMVLVYFRSITSLYKEDKASGLKPDKWTCRYASDDNF